MVGYAKCKDLFAPNTEADVWASKLKLVEKYRKYYGGWGFIMENAPCWTYEIRSYADGADAVTKIITTYTDKGCWYGVCRHHAYVYTAIFQERVKGQYNSVSGYPTKAVYAGTTKHAWVEVYIKDRGYFVCDVALSRWLLPRSYYGDRGADRMCNRWGIGNAGYRDEAPYKKLWAGPEIAPPAPPPVTPPPVKTYIKATTSPSGAQIWLKKH